MTLTQSPPPVRPPSSVLRPPDWNDRVQTCDGLVGRISFVWEKRTLTSDLRPLTSVFYRVNFPIPSPYFDDWAVYRASEVQLLPPK